MAFVCCEQVCCHLCSLLANSRSAKVSAVLTCLVDHYSSLLTLLREVSLSFLSVSNRQQAAAAASVRHAVRLAFCRQRYLTYWQLHKAKRIAEVNFILITLTRCLRWSLHVLVHATACCNSLRFTLLFLVRWMYSSL